MNKDCLLTVGEFAKLSDVTKNTIVWYEKNGLLQPAHVGENGYHYYSPEQYFDIDLIQNLKYFDFTLNECSTYIHSRNESDYLPMMIRHEDYLNARVEAVLRQKGCVEMTIRDYLTAKESWCEQPMVINMNKSYILATEFDDADDQRNYVAAYRKVYNLYHEIEAEYNLCCSMLNMAIVPKECLHSHCEWKRTWAGIWINKSVPVDACKTIPAGKYVVCYHRGNRDNIGQTYQKIQSYICRENFQVMGDCIERDVINHFAVQSSNEFLREIMVPIIE